QWGAVVHGTFVNPNHFGALMALAAPCALALALGAPGWRWPALGAVFILDAAVLLSLGRVSVVAAAVGQALVLALRLRDERRRPTRGAGAVWPRAPALAVFVARDRPAAQVEATANLKDFREPVSKIQVWRNAARIIPDFPWTGVGRGAFEPALQHVSDIGGR